jgi:Protein of unknown function (DUF2510)
MVVAGTETKVLTRRHRSEDRSQRLAPAAAARGAWYPDPFGKAGERWWDGGRWTDEVRGEPAPTGTASLPRKPRSSTAVPRAAPPPESSRPQTAEPEAPARPEPEPAEPASAAPDGEPPPPVQFQAKLADVVGERLQFVRREPRESQVHELMSVHGVVASVSFSGSHRLATLACAEGSWTLTRRPHFDWQLLVRGPAGHLVGFFSGRQSLSGGTIVVHAGVEVGLEHGVLGMWTLHSLESRERLASLRAASRVGARNLGLTLAPPVRRRSEFPLVVLVGCAVVMLGRAWPEVGSPAAARSRPRGGAARIASANERPHPQAHP